MKKSLVIVESPSKAKTINKFLGGGFSVKATVGHIKNLPEGSLGVDIDGGYLPEYVTIPKQRKVISDLKKEAENADGIYIATDPDREGEAIAWHIANEIGKKNSNIHRAMFNEITQNAVRTAIENPLEIDKGKVDAQQARRIMDRIVGYQVSPILWKAIYKGSLSAGRVQSVALKLICEREEEIRAFKQEEYWSIHVLLETPEKGRLRAALSKINGVKAEIASGQTAHEIIADFSAQPFLIDSIERKKVRRKPAAPFITSTMQQEASSRAGFSPTRTMAIAQQLYEGVELGGEGSVGLITYMRTDSMRMSGEALQAVRSYISNTYGQDYVPAKPRVYKAKSKSKVQDAHECIRPTYFNRDPESVRKFLTPEQYKLYRLIWNRTLASQMSDALYDQTTVLISAGKYEFRSTGRIMLFPGFLKLWEDAVKDNGAANDNDEITAIPDGLAKNTPLTLKNTEPEQHFTQPPPKFSESSLVKELDQLGVGRPSTYAMIINTLKARKYVSLEKRRLSPTELGEIVNKVVSRNFPEILNVNFTARMETELDQIESGKKGYQKVLDNFYLPFRENLEHVLQNIGEIKKSLEVKTDVKCEKCGSDMIVKWGPYGKFYGCSAFPKCKNIVNIDRSERTAREPEKSDKKCPNCGSDMVVRSSRYGKFLGCSAFPKCKTMLDLDGKPIERKKRPARTKKK